MSIPKKSSGSYFLPFFLTFLLLGIGYYILKNNIQITDLTRIFQPPAVPKEKKVQLVFQEGEVSFRPWNSETWEQIKPETVIEAGDSLKTQKNGILVLGFFDKSEVRLASLSELKLTRLDKSPDDHIAYELVKGKIWRRGKNAATQNADTIITTKYQIIQIVKAAVVEVETDPETIRVMQGSVVINVSKPGTTGRKPLAKIELVAGKHLKFSDPENRLIEPISDDFLKSEWYLWNSDNDAKLYPIVFEAAVAEPAPVPIALENFPEGAITVVSPKAGDLVLGKILVTGTFDPAKISGIEVNGIQATLDLENGFEAAISIAETQNTITVLGIEKETFQKKLGAEFTVIVDATGPVLGKIIQPVLDTNGYGVVGEKLELIGEIATDAVSVCVRHQDGEPYCLKQFKTGDKIYKYLGAVKYGNVVKGKNKYAIVASDRFGNKSEKIAYLFKDIPVPQERMAETASTTEPVAALDFPKPVIISPDPEIPFETPEKTVLIEGTVDPKTISLYVNGKKAPYQAGTEQFSITVPLESGENLIKIQAIDGNGVKSKVSLLKVISL